MGNTLIIAKKEFGDILTNNVIIISIAIFSLLAIYNIYDIYNGLAAQIIVNIHGAIAGSILFVLTGYGFILGVIIGITSISNERRNRALNVLISKPVYRDTIINGKLIGSLCVLSCIFGFIIIIYTAILLLVCGNIISLMMLDYVVKLPFVLFISVFYVMIFLNFSMFISILVNDFAASTIMSVTAWSLLLFIQNVTFASGVAALIPGSDSNTMGLIAGLSPYAILTSGGVSKFFESADIVYGMSSMGSEVIKLLIYLFIAVVVCYIAFLRRDIA